MEKLKTFFTKEQFFEAMKNAEKRTCIVYDDLPHTLKKGKSFFVLELLNELKKIKRKKIV